MTERQAAQWIVEPDAKLYQCPTTLEWFVPLSTKEQTIRGHRFIWVYCPKCDRYNHTRRSRDFDPLQPQPHCYTIRSEP